MHDSSSPIFWKIYARTMGGFPMETPGPSFKAIRSLDQI